MSKQNIGSAASAGNQHGPLAAPQGLALNYKIVKTCLTAAVLSRKVFKIMNVYIEQWQKGAKIWTTCVMSQSVFVCFLCIDLCHVLQYMLHLQSTVTLLLFTLITHHCIPVYSLVIHDFTLLFL